jgi:hypothetical protein
MVGMMVAPLVSIASIGTQISEAFAGLDRIRELRDVATEDATTTPAASRWTTSRATSCSRA